MAAYSNIEWCDHTHNEWFGCTEVSKACDHCYAKRWAEQFHPGKDLWEPAAARVLTGEKNRNNPFRWNSKPFWHCLKTGKRGYAEDFKCECVQGEHQPARARVFCSSLSDVFDNQVPVEWQASLFDKIRLTQNLDWLLLTKRIGNWRKIIREVISMPAGISKELASWLAAWDNGEWPSNVWIGITACDQEEFDRDAPKLIETPAARRFVSFEPLLGEIDASRHVDQIDWGIVGGETGPGARPMHPVWALKIIEAFERFGKNGLFKQWGDWSPAEAIFGNELAKAVVERAKATHQWPDGFASYLVGKRVAGRKLYGRLIDGYPD